MSKARKKPIHPYLIALGAEIKAIRTQKKLSLEELGGDLGLDASNYQKLELGQNLTINTLLRVCICLKITPAKLFDRVGWNLTEKDLEALTTGRPTKAEREKKSKAKPGAKTRKNTG